MLTRHVRAGVFENMDYHNEPIVPTPIHAAMVHVGSLLGATEKIRELAV